MTPDELRALDCWIAEHVFGLKLCGKHTAGYVVDADPRWCGQEPVYECYEDEIGRYWSVSKYSTDPDDAWAVVERMQERGFAVLVLSPGANVYVVGFGLEAAKSAETMPLAVCLAAKAAIEGRAKE